MEVPADLRYLHQLGEPPLCRRLDLALILPDFRRNPAQTERLVHSFFRLAGDFLIVLAAKQAVFAKLQAHFYSSGTDRDAVVLAASEVLQGCPEAVARKSPNVHLDAIPAQ